MRQLWTSLASMVSVPAGIVGALFLCAASASADPIAFSSGGGMGYYFDAFLVSSEPASPEDTHHAVVRIVSNDGNVSEGEWSVDCSMGLPRVVRPDGSDILIDLVEGPSSATLTDHELWWAVCTGEPRALSSDHVDPAAKVEPRASGSFEALSSTFRFEVLQADKAAVMSSLATLRISGGAMTGFDGQEAVVFCSTEPTVFWRRSDLMVQVGWTALQDQHGKDVGEVSAALHQAVCEPHPEGQASLDLGSEQRRYSSLRP